MADIFELLKRKAKEQYAQGQPYRDLFFRGDPSGVLAKLGAWKNLPMDEKVAQATDIGMGFAGTMKGVGKTPFEIAHEVAQKNAALPVEKGGLGLPKNNTAMDRAKAMGFDTPAYHATNHDIKYFIPSDVGTYGPGIYTAKHPEVAEGYYQDFINSNTMPLLLNKGKEKQFQSFSDYVGQKGKERNTFDYRSDLKNEGYNSLSVKFFPEGEVREYNNFNPSDVRSIFAAFDPFRRNEADILAGLLAVPATQLLEDDKDKKKRKTK